ncbi:hypothetical protein ACS0TY_034016 [Phlomoides rotata]
MIRLRRNLDETPNDVEDLDFSHICSDLEGCDQPLTVRFVDPKRPRPGVSR